MKWLLKRFIYLAMFGGVIFIPLVLFTGGTSTDAQTEESDGILNSISIWLQETGDSIEAFFSDDESPPKTIEDVAMTTPNPDGQSPHLDGGLIMSIEEILDFHITPKQITNRWARVSFHVQDNGLHSYRVPVVTGEKQDDLAGSLAYLVDENEKLQRIDFLGFTHDPSTLIEVMKREHRMTKRPSHVQALYIKSQNKLPVSALRIIASEIISTSAPANPLKVRLELNRLHLGATLSDSFRALLKADKQGEQI